MENDLSDRAIQGKRSFIECLSKNIFHCPQCGTGWQQLIYIKIILHILSNFCDRAGIRSCISSQRVCPPLLNLVSLFPSPPKPPRHEVETLLEGNNKM